MLKDHKFWAMAACFCMFMCMMTGMKMTSGKKKKAEKEEE